MWRYCIRYMRIYIYIYTHNIYIYTQYIYIYIYTNMEILYQVHKNIYIYIHTHTNVEILHQVRENIYIYMFIYIYIYKPTYGKRFCVNIMYGTTNGSFLRYTFLEIL